MTTTYTKSLTADFSGNLNPDQMQNEIEADIGISATCNIVLNLGDNVKIIFDAALTTGEQTILDGLISSHVPNFAKTRETFFPVNPKNKSSSSTSYFTMAKFQYDGSDVIGEIDYVDIITYMDSGITSYSARILDKTNGKVIVETTGLNNLTESIQGMGLMSNIPTNTAILELQMKRVGGDKTTFVYVDSINVYHGN